MYKFIEECIELRLLDQCENVDICINIFVSAWA